jgi:hypothetical protein
MSTPIPNTTTPDDQVPLLLTKAEALVLFEFVSRYSENNKLDIQDQAEQRVLWDLFCRLESVLAEPFRSDYDTILSAARDKVRDDES